ncbi:MAG: UDP-3-O-(3-hydroxymyristoyl)glucosamine N-acyltransferase [Flavobacteriales bacterium]|nr:UDP-3-O-(3-hydroxymyristoyl)glucosamine N-acyltransferase [Flavobacteriales bacterium]
MEFSADQISQLLEGSVEGNGNTTVSTLSKIEEGKKGSLSFLANPKYTEYIYDTEASTVIVGKDFKAERKLKHNPTLIKVEDAYAAFGKLLEMYNQVKNNKVGISSTAIVSESASIGENVYLGENVVIGDNTKIADGVKIFPNSFIGDNASIETNTTVFAGAKIYSETQIGKECVIHSGVILGADGFGFAPNSENNYKKVPQIGNVIIEDYVEIGANTCIDRATLGSTIIRKGVKLDNLIQIAHNVDIGENTVIAAQTGIAGSTKIGKNCMIGGQVGIVGHLKIAGEVKIAAQSGIGHSIEEKGAIVQGSPSIPIGDYKRSYVMFRKLPSMASQIRELEKQIEELKSSVSS